MRERLGVGAAIAGVLVALLACKGIKDDPPDPPPAPVAPPSVPPDDTAPPPLATATHAPTHTATPHVAAGKGAACKHDADCQKPLDCFNHDGEKTCEHLASETCPPGESALKATTVDGEALPVAYCGKCPANKIVVIGDMGGECHPPCKTDVDCDKGSCVKFGTTLACDPTKPKKVSPGG
jgi:hypothetical protein